MPNYLKLPNQHVHEHSFSCSSNVSWPATRLRSWSNVPQSLWPSLPLWNQEKFYSPTANNWGEHYSRIWNLKMHEDAWRCMIWLRELMASHPQGHPSVYTYCYCPSHLVLLLIKRQWRCAACTKAWRCGSFSPIAKPHLPPWLRGSMQPGSCGSYQISRASGPKAFQPEKRRMLYFQVCGIFMK